MKATGIAAAVGAGLIVLGGTFIDLIVSGTAVAVAYGAARSKDRV